jgi:hypothetical protein
MRGPGESYSDVILRWRRAGRPSGEVNPREMSDNEVVRRKQSAMPTPQPNPPIPVPEPDVIRPPTPQEEPQPDKGPELPQPGPDVVIPPGQVITPSPPQEIPPGGPG